MNSKSIQIAKNKYRWVETQWADHLFVSKYFIRKFKYNKDVGTNYVADILNYMGDIFGVLEQKRNIENFSMGLERAISFLQSIYIQQDFTNELLRIFRTGINVGALKLDPNYQLNRDIRNELVGHPVRQIKDGRLKLISSTLFVKATEHTFTYLKYSQEGNWRQNKITVKFQDTLDRHSEFLNVYLDFIVSSIREQYKSYQKELESILSCIDKLTLSRLVNRIELSFESFFRLYRAFTRENIMKLEQRSEHHTRYNFCLKLFYSSLKSELESKIDHIKQIMDEDLNVLIQHDQNIFQNLVINDDKFTDTAKAFTNPNQEIERWMGKLGSIQNFDNFSQLVEEYIIRDGKAVLELDHMRNNLDNDFEYYSAYEYLDHLININKLASD